MPPKKSNKKISSQPAQPAVEASTSVASVSASPLNDLTNLNFLLQQQQNQFMESSAKVALRQQEAIYSNSAISVEQPISTPPVTTSDTPISTNKLSNRWTSPEIRVLIEEVGKHQQMLQKVKDPREKGRIWDTIVSNIQSSSVAGPVLKERSKTSIQQKWDALFQKYRDIKDTVASTGEEPLQNDWEFFYDIDEYLRSDPSVEYLLQAEVSNVKHKNVKSLMRTNM
ncbi:hypothetical protein C2G38_2187210 [Gigaspora rosea]|uniref:Myb/SANT-like DNA-binding domain-containing protein n=1 Tax=Gigaspora rosea TaxID=44941 RepID=A0A397V7Z1_9GLOM|nr:hypothetical protein C2G38_2187210 [Gigaspora rosea]